MLNKRINFKTIFRAFNTSTCHQQVNIKQVKMMKKIMSGHDKGKRQWKIEEYPKMVSPEKLSNPANQGKEANRRVTVLNNLFMKNVTDLMTSGVFAEKIFGYGIQISTVKIAADFKKLNIFWFAKEKSNDAEIDAILKSIAGPLRHELSILRLMGEIPQINFCRDKSLFKSAELDYFLQRADFGEDFVPTDATLFMKPPHQLEMKLPEHLKQKIRQLDKEIVEHEEEEIEESIPTMRNDIFHLDHARMMASITASMNKFSKAWENYKSEENTDEKRNQNISNMEIEINKLTKEAEQRVEFMKFLEKRRFEKKITPERKKFIKEQHMINLHEENLEDQYEEIPDNDFILEDERK